LIRQIAKTFMFDLQLVSLLVKPKGNLSYNAVPCLAAGKFGDSLQIISVCWWFVLQLAVYF